MISQIKSTEKDYKPKPLLALPLHLNGEHVVASVVMLVATLLTCESVQEYSFHYDGHRAESCLVSMPYELPRSIHAKEYQSNCEGKSLPGRVSQGKGRHVV